MRLVSFEEMTREEFDLLSVKEENTYYLVKEDGVSVKYSLYFGEHPVVINGGTIPDSVMENLPYSALIELLNTDMFYVLRGSTPRKITVENSGLIVGNIPLSFYNRMTKPSEYGEIVLPENFIPKNRVPKLYRDVDGVKTVDEITIFDDGDVDNEFYLDFTTGNDTGGTSGGLNNPFRSFAYAVERINNLGAGNYIVYIKKNEMINRLGWSSLSTNITINNGINIKVKSLDGERILITSGTPFSALLWESYESIYRAFKSGNPTLSVIDLDIKDIFGVPQNLKKVSTIEECKLTNNSWLFEDSYIYINRNSIPTERIVCNQNYAGTIVLVGNASLEIEKATILLTALDGGTQVCLRVKQNGSFSNNNGTLILKDCVIVGSKYSGGSSFISWGLKNTYLINCIASQGFSDNLNYQAYTSNKEENRNNLVYEYGVISYDAGENSVNDTNNASSAHGGLSILRINTIGYLTRGPVIVDVDGCFSFNIDCHVRDTYLSSGSQSNGFQFYGHNDLNTIAYLIGCSSRGKTVNDLRVNYNNVNIYLQNCNFRKILGLDKITIYEGENE